MTEHIQHSPAVDDSVGCNFLRQLECESANENANPCAHCTVAAAVATVLRAEIGTGAMPTLTTTSYLVKGPARTWTKIDGFMQEVANPRVYDGVHFRNSTEVGTGMGKQIGALAVAKFLRRPD